MYAITKWILCIQSTQVHQPIKNALARSNFMIYSFAIPAFRLSYLLNGYSRQFSLFSMCLPS